MGVLVFATINQVNDTFCGFPIGSDSSDKTASTPYWESFTVSRLIQRWLTGELTACDDMTKT